MLELTVVMSVYNGGSYLIPALESILTQSIRDFEFLIVDDGSTDGTTRILEEYARRDSRITLIRQENAGTIASLIKACALVTTPYIARMDADDISATDRFERQLDFLERNREVALLGGAAEYINDAGEVLSTCEFPTSDGDIRARLATGNVFVSSAVVMRRDAALMVGGYRRAFLYAEDYDLWLRIAERHQVANLAEVLVSYRVHPKQATTKGLEQQLLSAIGARMSAKMRQTLGEDPFESTAPVSREQLCRLGVASSEIEEQLGKAYAAWAEIVRQAGYYERAATLATEARRQGGAGVLTRKKLAQFYIAYARASALEGRVLQGAVQATRAVWLHPALLLRLFRKYLGKAIGR
jgi:glycosyltransferase involved in cell wall biosynthesis